MEKIKYFDGKKTIEVEVSEKFAAGYKELQRKEWRSNKRWERHIVPISLTQMEDENGFQVVDLTVVDPLDQIIEREEREERCARVTAALNALTPKQKQLTKLLMKGLIITEIAKRLNISKAAVCEARAWLQKKFKKFLYQTP